MTSLQPVSVFSQGSNGTESLGEFLLVPDHEEALFSFGQDGELVPAYWFDLASLVDGFAPAQEVSEFLTTGELPGWVDVGDNLYPEPVAHPAEVHEGAPV